jgi:hypothetical protein
MAQRRGEEGVAARKRRAEFSWREKTEPDNTVITFPAEYKRAQEIANMHQLIYDLATASSHRYVIGIPDEVIYGGTSVGGVFTVFASRWEAEHPDDHSVPISSHTRVQCCSRHHRLSR